MDQSLGQRQRERSSAQRRLSTYTKRIVVGSGVLAAVLSLIAAQSDPGHAGPAAPSAQTSAGSTVSSDQQPVDPNANSGFFGGGGGGAPIAVTGGS